MKLTLPQQDVYFEQLVFPNDPIYNIGAKIKIQGSLEINVMQQAYIALINQHDTYRTILIKEDENIITQVTEKEILPLEVVDFSDKVDADIEANLFMQQQFTKPFELFSDEFFHHFILVKVTEQCHYLFSVYHHIITDGWGTSLMFQRLVRNYNEIITQGEIQSAYPFSYKEFAKEDTLYQASEDFEKDKAYWSQKFEKLPESLFEKIDTTKVENKSSRQVLIVKRAQYDELENLAKNYKSSTFHVILALLYLYFGRKHQNQDFAIGLPVLNRRKSVFKKTVGLFMGVLPLRMQLDFEESFVDLLANIKNQLRKDYRHQRFPLGKLIKELQAFSNKDQLFNITLSYEKQDYADHFEGTKTTVVPMTHGAERVALAVYIREFDKTEDVSIDFDYNLNYFDQQSIQQVVQHFEELINNVLDHPTERLGELTFVTKKEKQLLLEQFNDTTQQYPKESTFLDLFKEQVRSQQTKIAVVDKDQSYSYLELDQKSDQIAQCILNQKNCDNTNVIGVLLERTTDTIAVLLGIMKAGKAYVPLDPKFPTERLQYIIDHSGIGLLISDQPEATTQFHNVSTISLRSLVDKAGTIHQCNLSSVKAQDTAYIIYTSGSTGNPKGVEIGHQSLLNFLMSMQKSPGISKTDLLFAVTTYSFDISILEFFVPLISGATLYIANHKTLSDYRSILESLQKIQPTILQATPSFFQLLVNGGWTGSNKLKVLCGGDALSQDLANKLLNGCSELWNMYGPTETTIWSSIKQVQKPEEASIIGKPIANTQFYILDAYQQLQPVGTPGELYIAGDGLAKGYYEAPELTSQKFIQNPFGAGLIYNTNDLAKWNDNGEVIFLGRSDHQVKVRGYRVELGEIETKLNEIPEIKKAIVVSKKQTGQEAFLVAYITKEEKSYKTEDCIPVLEKQLPQYMVPYVVIAIDEFPLTPNKKINRKELAQRKIQKSNTLEETEKISTPLQSQLKKYWQSVLQYDQELSVHENFFSLGGHSLNAIKLVNLISSELGYQIGLKEIFDYPTISLLSDYLSLQTVNPVDQIKFAEVKERYVVTSSQYEIWLASQSPMTSIAYNMVAVFDIDGTLDIVKLNNAMQKLLEKHEVLRTNFIEERGEVFQTFRALHQIDFEVTYHRVNENTKDEVIQNYINQEFDLSRDVLLKMILIETDNKSSQLVFCTHHSIMDGWSLEILIKDFLTYLKDGFIKSTEKRLQFKDYTDHYFPKLNQKENAVFWEDYLSDYEIKSSLEWDKEIPSQSQNGEHYHFELTMQQTEALKKYVNNEESTVYAYLVTLVNILFLKLSGHRDLVLGTVNAGRNIAGINDMIGMFVKTLPLRTKLNEEQFFKQVLGQVQNEIVNLDTFQDVPLDHKKETMFDALVSFQNPDFSYKENLQMANAKMKSRSVDVSYCRLPLLFNFYEADNKLQGTITYDTSKYYKTSIEIVVLTFLGLIDQTLEELDVRVSGLVEEFSKEKIPVEIEFNF